MFNGYEKEVASLYKGLDLKRIFNYVTTFRFFPGMGAMKGAIGFDGGFVLTPPQISGVKG